jgi:hypothetical protein
MGRHLGQQLLRHRGDALHLVPPLLVLLAPAVFGGSVGGRAFQLRSSEPPTLAIAWPVIR